MGYVEIRAAIVVRGEAKRILRQAVLGNENGPAAGGGQRGRNRVKGRNRCFGQNRVEEAVGILVAVAWLELSAASAFAAYAERVRAQSEGCRVAEAVELAPEDLVPERVCAARKVTACDVVHRLREGVGGIEQQAVPSFAAHLQDKRMVVGRADIGFGEDREEGVVVAESARLSGDAAGRAVELLRKLPS